MTSILQITKPESMPIDEFMDGIVFGVEHGCSAGCPFCLGRKTTEFQVGDEVYFLNGSDAGRAAEIVRVEVPSSLFHVRFQDTINNETCRIDLKHQVVVFLSEIQHPNWLLPLSVDDNWAVENSLIGYISRTGKELHKRIPVSEINSVAYVLWRRRLPVSSREVTSLALAHGLPETFEDEFGRLLEVSWRAMEYANGRIPVKRKRMKPFAKGRYLTPKNEEFIRRLKGIV